MLIAVVAVVLLAGGSWWFGQYQARDEGFAKVASLPHHREVKPLEPMRPAYETLRQFDERRRADAALEQPGGAAAVPDLRGLEPAAKEQPLARDERWARATPVPDPAPAIDPKIVQQRIQLQTRAAKFVDSYTNQRLGHSSLVYFSPDDEAADAAAPATVVATAAPDAATRLERRVPDLYDRHHIATLKLALNSDVPGPVIAEIVRGPLAGARLDGRFNRVEDYVRIEFEQMRFQGQGYTVSAVAFDLDDGSIGVTSTTNYRTVSRWAAVLASAVFEGWANATLAQGGDTIYFRDFVIDGRRRFDDEEIASIIAGEVGERTRPIAEQYFNRPPTVRVHEPVGLYFLSIGR